MAIEPITIDEITSGKPARVGEIESISPEELFGEVVPTEAIPTLEVPEEDAIPTPNIFDLMLDRIPTPSHEQLISPEVYKIGHPPTPVDEFDAGELAPVFSEESMQSLDKTWKSVNETLGEFAELTADPVKFAKGVGELAFSIPGFLVGLPVAAQRIVETVFKQVVDGQTLNLEEVYFATAKGMQETMEVMQPGVEAVWGKTDEQRQLVGAVAMAPLTGLSTLGSEIAGWKGFEDYPNIRGAARFSGDIAGFLALGAVYGRGRKIPVAAKVRDVAKKAEDIKVAEEILEQIPEDAARRAKERVLEVEKKQLELELEELKKKIDLDAEIKKDLKKKGKKVKEIKKEGIEVEAIREERLKYAKDKVEEIEPLEGPPEVVEPKVKVKKVRPKVKIPELKSTEEALEFGEVATPEQIEVLRSKWNESLLKSDALKTKGDLQGAMDEAVRGQLFRETIESSEVKVKEPTTELDRQTGTSLPTLEDEQSPFFQSKESTENLKGVYERRAETVNSDIEVHTQKLINDINRWYHGDEGVDITKVRNDLSELATRADELRMNFVNVADFNAWKETVSEVAVWGRRIEPDRLKIEQRGDVGTKQRDAQQLALEVHDIFENKPKTDISVLHDLTRKYSTSTIDLAADLLMNKGMDESIPPKQRIKIIANARWLKTRALSGVKYKTRKRGKLVPPPDVGTKLYSGIPLDEAGKAIVKAGKTFKDYVDHARGVKRFKPKEAAKTLNKEFKRSFIDRSGSIRLELLDKLGNVGYKVIQKMYLTKGAYALSADKLRQMKKEVYGGLSRKEKQTLDNLILADRMADIAKYKTEKQFKFPRGLSPTETAAYIELFQYYEKLSSKRAEVIRDRSKAYFEWMKKPLKDMLDAELISKEEYDALVTHNYRRIKLVDIFDKRYQAKIGKKKRTIYDSGVEALAKGRDTDIYEPSSEIMALEVFNRAYGRILNNEANLSLAEVAKNDPKNPFVRVKVKGKPIPSGWQRHFFYEKGGRKSMYLSPEMSKEWITNNPEISYRMGQFLRYTSMSPVLRTFATGINWGFALANLPRDVMHTWYAARTFDGKEWKGVYSPHMPIYLAEMGRDLVTVFPDAITRGPRYKDYINRGGGMEFLVHQGRILSRGRKLEGPLDKIQDFLGYFGETTELAPRLAIKERVTRDRIKEGMKEEDAKNEGTFAARDYMDFGQGGGITKAADNAMPYLNAGVQGTRGLWRTANDNPKLFAYKVAQLGAMVTLLYTAMREQAPETTEALQGSIDMQNNLCIPMGDNFSFEDEEGQTRYIYYKIPLDPSQKFFKTFFEAFTDKMLGNEVDVERITNNMAEQSPVGITSLPPTLSGGIGYLYNKDLWRNKDVWRKTKPFDWPKSKEEYIPGETPQFYTDIGKATGLSPERTGHAIEEVTTSGTMWSYLMGKGYEKLFVDVPKSQREQHLAMVLSQMPIAKRFIGVTHPYTKYKGGFKESEQKADLEHWAQTREVDRLTEGYLFQDSYERRDVWKYINTFKEKVVRDRLIKRFDFQVAMKDVPERSFWLRLQSLKVKAKAEVYYERWSKTKDDPEKMKQLSKEAARVEAAGGVFSDRFWDEFRKLRKNE